jgi:hypothetical protein
MVSNNASLDIKREVLNMEIEINEILAKKILTDAKGYLDVGFTHSLNPYSGCRYSCQFWHEDRLLQEIYSRSRLINMDRDYIKNGFCEVGLFKYQGILDGEFADVLAMEKLL